MLIGEITSPQGLQGEVRVFPHTDYPERFAKLKEIGLQRGEQIEVRRVLGARQKDKIVILRLEGSETIDDAEALRGTRLFIPQEWIVTPGQDEYFHHQLLGLEVITTEGEALGPITEIWPTAAHDVYETPLALIPAVKEYVLAVDIAAGQMTVLARPGLKKSEPGY